MEEILIDIDEKGNVQVEANGVVGADCKTLTADLERELGDVEAVKYKPAYRQARPQARKVGA